MQSEKFENLPPLMSPAIRLFIGTLLISMVIAIIASAISLPFFFESSSMLYKFGADKTLLRSGKILGLITACLVILQSVLSARIKFLDRIFALNNMMNVHRICGIIIAGCALIHPVLIFLPEDMTTIPFSFRYWPEFAGLFLLAIILGIVLVALLRLKLNISFNRWRIMHQWAAFSIYITMLAHILFVSETFEKGLPQTIIYCTIGFYFIVFAWVRLKPLLIRKKPFTVSEIEIAGQDAIRLKITPDAGKPFSYFPGQFGFISIKSPNISLVTHPFTIASTPSCPDTLEFIIRTNGDWTRNLGDVKPRDRVYVDGPFGLFTHLRCPQNSEIIMIAGGIGITPMLSMLRFLSDAKDFRSITLIWSNRTEQHIIMPEEFNWLEKNLPGFRIVHVITDDPDNNGKCKKLDQSGLEKLLLNCSRKSAVFVCGPPVMMTDIRKILIRMGFSRNTIFMEAFSL